MHEGNAYIHRFPEDGREHLWFVLSEPSGMVLTVCISMTSSHPAGESVIRIPGNTILTDGTRLRNPYVTDHLSTLFISGPKLLSQARLDEVFPETNCCGRIKERWLWEIRRAVRDGMKYVRNAQIRSDIAVIVAS